MNRVFLNFYDRTAVTADTAITFEHPLARRMSPMQLSVLEGFAKLQTRCPALSEKLWKNPLPIYFATAYGELSSALKVAEAVYGDALPCSPTAFQHSVHNCAPAYLTMAQNIHHPSLTISSGCLSFEKALFVAFQKISNGICDAAIVIGGKDLLTSDKSILGECEIAILCSTDFCLDAPILSEVTGFQYIGDKNAAESFLSDLDPNAKQMHWHEDAKAKPDIPLWSEDYPQAFRRIVSNLDGELVTSTWKGFDS